jgi:hypothetical protein
VRHEDTRGAAQQPVPADGRREHVRRRARVQGRQRVVQQVDRRVPGGGMGGCVNRWRSG